MSITPYNNLSVKDLNGNQQSYVNSTTEVGYFSGEYSGTIPNGRVFSLPAFLKTNNGVATVDPSGSLGLKLNAGIYKINLSLFPTSTQDGSSNISFNFGTRQMLYDSSNNLVDAFGGVCPIGMFTYDPSNNPYSPGIISWVADGYSSSNTISNFQQNPYTCELAYKYNNAGYSDKKLYSGISTTEMTFVLNSSATIYFNAYNNSNADITMGNCCFTLKLISSRFTVPVPTWNWQLKNSGLPAVSEPGYYCGSSGTGQYLGIVGNSGNVYTSSNYGATWIARSGPNSISPSNGLPTTVKTWYTIAYSLSGQYVVVVASTGPIYMSIDYGVNWTSRNSAVSSAAWQSVAISGDGSVIAAGYFTNGGSRVWRSLNFGVTWSIIVLPAATTTMSFSSITISYTGQYMAAVSDYSEPATTAQGIWTSNNFGATWTQRYEPAVSWKRITSSINGQYLLASKQGDISKLFTSSNYGVTWIVRTTGYSINAWGLASSSNGQYLYASSIANSNIVIRSSNYGVTWSAVTEIPTQAWKGVASTSDGKEVIALGNISSGTGSVYIGVLS